MIETSNSVNKIGYLTDTFWAELLKISRVYTKREKYKRSGPWRVAKTHQILGASNTISKFDNNPPHTDAKLLWPFNSWYKPIE